MGRLRICRIGVTMGECVVLAGWLLLSIEMCYFVLHSWISGFEA